MSGSHRASSSSAFKIPNAFSQTMDETHRMGNQSPSYRTTTSTWQTQTTFNGHTFNNTSKLPSETADKLKGTISDILTEFKSDATINEVARFSKRIMNTIDAEVFGSAQDDHDRPSTSRTDHRMSNFSQQSQTTSTVSKKTTLKKTASQTTKSNVMKSKTFSTNKIEKTKKEKPVWLSRMAEDAKNNGKKLSLELLRLMPSNGFVDIPPRRSKRASKAIERFSDLNFDKPPRRRSSRQIGRSNSSNAVVHTPTRVSASVFTPTVSTPASASVSTSVSAAMSTTKSVLIQQKSISVSQSDPSTSGELICYFQQHFLLNLVI